MFTKFLKAKTKKVIGVDIGSNAIKAVLLSKLNNDYQVESVISLPIIKGMVVDHAITDVEALSLIIKKLKNHFSKSGTNFVATAVSGSGVMMKNLCLDKVASDDELAMQIDIEAERLIPYPLDEISLDFEVIQENETNPEKIDVLLVASRTELIQTIVEVFYMAKFEAKIIDIEGYALGRSIELVKHQLSLDEYKSPIALVDIGASTITVAIVINGKTVFVKEHAFEGEQYTHLIVSHDGIDSTAAEQTKVDGDLSSNHIADIFNPFKIELVQQLKRLLFMFNYGQDDIKIQKIILSGGCSNIGGITTLLENEMEISCVLASPFSQCKIAKNINLTHLGVIETNFMIACGLALRGVNND